MKDYLLLDEWKVVEQGLTPAYNRISESVFSLGNGRFGQRGNFEEHFSGKTLQGNYVAGVYYPDKTRVGWWKNGYPEYFAKVLNAANWIEIGVQLGDETLDLNHCEVKAFQRVLDMKTGVLERTFEATTRGAKTIQVETARFCSIADSEIGAICYKLKVLDFEGTISLIPAIDFDVKNEDANYDEKFWVEIGKEIHNNAAFITAETKKTFFHVCTGMQFDILKNGKSISFETKAIEREKYIASFVEIPVQAGDELVVYKYAGIVSSMNYEKSELAAACKNAVARASASGFDALREAHAAAWATKWQESDIIIEGDTAAQQGIRFNIFQLNQTYTGEDERLNIGPKGFTGEKYGGSTYWDTEAYCLPFYLATADRHVARQLLIYRHKHLQKAIENAEKLGFKNGAALYPMVTMNGEECHNEWEITFEEIHRNGAIAYGIFDYIRYTGDADYLTTYGAEVLVGIARFWSQRVNYSTHRGQYVMLGVTGPNEYENNANNNWYTSYIACWCMEYAETALRYVQQTAPEAYAALVEKLQFDEATELAHWNDIRVKMYLPTDEATGIILQQDNYLDKEQILVKDLDRAHLPLNKKWSWDRILRSCFIKQADVLQGLYFFEERFDLETIRQNYEFYEPRTVHESSLSPCVHSILAAVLGYKDDAYRFYLRTARLDLNDYNSDTDEGLHITSMAGTWMAVVKGFGGMRVGEDGILSFKPFIPEKWKAFAFKIRFRTNLLKIYVAKEGITVENQSEIAISVRIFDEITTIDANYSAYMPHIN